MPGGEPAAFATAERLAATVPGVRVLAGPSAPRTLGAVADEARPADVIVVSPGIKLFNAWLARLVAAAHCESTVATASALLSRGRWAPEPVTAASTERVAKSVATHSGRLYPRVSEPQAGCVLLCRAALEIAGLGDDAPFACWLAEFAERCNALGLSHVVADDVLAWGDRVASSQTADAALDERWPHRAAARALDELPESPIRSALLTGSRALDRLSVTIDGRALSSLNAGTEVHALELIAALGRTGEVALRVLMPPRDLDPGARSVLEAIDDLTQLTCDTAIQGSAPPTDIVHRPSQAFSADDLNLLLPLGQRLVVTHQDLILYRIAGYHATAQNWLDHRHLTRNMMAAADRVVFFSEHARDDALADGLIDPAAALVIPIGVDHHVSPSAEPRCPRRLANDTPFLLCLGSDLRHKNRDFAVKLLAVLRARDGWGGQLVLAGPQAHVGRAPIDTAGQPVVELGAVCDDEKAWLLAHASAVVYPTLYEGFGLVPFEAANAGTPCLFASQTSLAEVLPRDAATIMPWDAEASATAAAALLAAGPARDAHVSALRAAGERYRWDETAGALLRLYRELVVTPPRPGRRGPQEQLLVHARVEELKRENAQERERHERFREEIGEDGIALVGRDGYLEAGDKRALLSLMARRSLRRPLLRAAGSVYAVGSKLRRAGMSDHEAPR